MMNYKVFLLTLLAAVVAGGCVPASGRIGTAGADAAKVCHDTDGLEIPAYGADEHVVVYDGFTSSYNHTTLIPDWVAYELLETELNGEYRTKSSNFSRDPDLEGRQASREDYSRSGWDRGHMAPKADMRWSSAAYWQSHYFTNICPQNHEFNAGDWNKLEKKVRKWAEQYGRVWVVCGPIFTTHEYGTIGAAAVHVPDQFFKALLVEDDGRYAAIAYVMPNYNRRRPLAEYACTVDSLESLIGRDLFPGLEDSVENAVEREIVWEYWQ